MNLQPNKAPTPLEGGKGRALHALEKVLLFLLELLDDYGPRFPKLSPLPYLVGDVFGPSLLAQLTTDLLITSELLKSREGDPRCFS